MSIDEVIAVLIALKEKEAVPGDTLVRVDQVTIVPTVIEIDYSSSFGVMIHTEAS